MVGQEHPDLKRRALHVIAVFEAIKGIAALAATIGLLDLLHHDVRHLALELIGHFALHPDARYPAMLVHYADLMSGTDVRSLVFLASGYIVLRLSEAYGLWNDRVWGEKPGARRWCLGSCLVHELVDPGNRSQKY